MTAIFFFLFLVALIDMEIHVWDMNVIDILLYEWERWIPTLLMGLTAMGLFLYNKMKKNKK